MHSIQCSKHETRNIIHKLCKLQTNARLNHIKRTEWHGYRFLSPGMKKKKWKTNLNVYLRGIDLMCIWLMCYWPNTAKNLFTVSFEYESVMKFEAILAYYYRLILSRPCSNLIYFMLYIMRKPDEGKINVKLDSKVVPTARPSNGAIVVLYTF